MGKRRKRAGDRLRKSRKEQQKEGLSREVATTAASGDIPRGTAHHKERDSKESAMRAECRDTQPSTVRKAVEKEEVERER